jgi:hypothetical protein
MFPLKESVEFLLHDGTRGILKVLLHEGMMRGFDAREIGVDAVEGEQNYWRLGK